MAKGDPLGWLVGSGAQRNFLGRYGVLAYIDTSGIGQIRDMTGVFNANQRRVTDLYRAAARELQSDVVNRTRRGYVRPRVSTGNLVRVYQDPRMIDVDKFGFVVGVETFLSTSSAKYWRQIEYGSKGVVPRWIGRMVDRQGIPLFGVWDFTVNGRGVNWGSASRYGAGTGQKLHPYSKAKREAMVYGDVRDSIGRRLGNRTPRAPYRRRHIQPKDAFAGAWDAKKISTELMDHVIDTMLQTRA